MSVISIKKGLDLPIIGVPSEEISKGKPVKTVAFVGHGFPGAKFSFKVKPGSKVKTGQVIAEERKNPAIKFVSPGTGKVVAIERGEKRAFLSLVIELIGKEEFSVADKLTLDKIKSLTRENAVKKLLSGGLWSMLVQRPFGIIPDPEDVPSSIFVNAMDTNPLSANPEIIIKENEKGFVAGLSVLACLTEGRVNLCMQKGSKVPHGESGRVVNHQFEGVHPAGLSGTHVHHLDPINNINKRVWCIGYQNVIAIGHYFLKGKYMSERYVALAGPQVKKPRIIKTVLGANLFDLTKDELHDGENRIISGSVLFGTQADEQLGFLGLFDNQVSVLREDRERVFHGFMTPGFNKFSVKKIFTSALITALTPGKKFDIGTSSEGSHRDVVPIGSYEAVMPLDILPTFLVRSLLSDDLELAEKIGALELLEEDASLLTYVCPGKNDIGKHLMKVLGQIRKENE